MITDNQTNKIYFSSYLENECPKLWASIHAALFERKIRHGLLRFPNYIWCRDYMPIQIADDNFVAYRFEPDYLVKEKRYHHYLSCDGYMICKEMTYPMTGIDLIIDGGNVVKCGDTIVMTEKVFHENRQISREEVERKLRDKLKSDILFLPWDREEEFGHSDGIVHFAGEGRVLMTNYEDYDPKLAKEIERRLEKKFDVIHLRYKSKRKHMRSWAYINFLQTEHLIMVPQLGIAEDEQALQQISDVFPEVETIGIPALEAVRRGGALNCISWNVKDNGAIPVKLEYHLNDVRNAFIHFGDNYLSDEIFLPLKRFIENSLQIPTQAEIHSISLLLFEKKEEIKRVSANLNYRPDLSAEDTKKWHQVKMWQIILSVLQPFIDQLKKYLLSFPYEFIQ